MNLISVFSFRISNSILPLILCSCSLLTPAVVEEVEEDTAEFVEQEAVKVLTLNSLMD